MFGVSSSYNFRMISTPSEIEKALNAPMMTPYSALIKGPEKKIKIAIVDTGVDFSHPLLKAYRSKSNLLQDEIDTMGHGTSVAGVMVIHLEKVYGKMASHFFEIQSFKYVPDSSDTEDTMVSYKSALARAVASTPDILNISTSGFGYDWTEYSLLVQANKQGTITVVAAGNEGTESPTFPCSYTDVLVCVGNVDNNGVIVPSSNYGPSVVVYAQGKDVFTSYPSNNWVFQTGTSFSSPLVASHFASLLVNPSTDREFEKYISIEPKSFWYRNPATISPVNTKDYVGFTETK